MPAPRKRPENVDVAPSSSARARTVASAATWVGMATTAVGVVAMMAGTFAPWLASGSSERNLYSSAGVVQRLAGLRSPAGLALDALPLAGIYCVLAGVAYVLGRRRIAGAAIALLALVLGGIAGAALAHRRTGQIHLLATGPVVTLCGAVVSLAALGLAAGLGRQRSTKVAASDKTRFPAPPAANAPPPAADQHTGPRIHPTTDGNRADDRPTMEFR